MKFDKVYKVIITLFFLTSVSLFTFSCGDQGTSNEEPGKGSCQVAFRILPPKTTDAEIKARAASMNCSELGIDSVTALVYNTEGILLKQGGPWDCEIGEGIVQDVPAGQIGNVIIICLDESGNPIYRGESPDILLSSDEIVDVGTIATQSFVPVPIAPANGSTVSKGSPTLRWSTVFSARNYRVRVSASEDFSETIVDEETSRTSQTIVTEYLVGGTTYYWQIVPNTPSGSATGCRWTC